MINEMEAEYQVMQSKKEALQKEIQDRTINFNQQIEKAEVNKQEASNYEQTGGLTEEQL